MRILRSVKIFFGSLVFQAISFLPTYAVPTTTQFQDVVIVRESSAQITTSNSFVDLPGATASTTVLLNEPAVLLVRFSGASSCSRGLTLDEVDKSSASGLCLIKILIDGKNLPPVDYRFDNSRLVDSTVKDSFKTLSIDRSSSKLKPGTYNIKVQWSVKKTSGLASEPLYFSLDDWSLTIQQIND